MKNHASDGAALQWLTTPEAAYQLRISQNTLRRMRDREIGLKPGVHYKRGLFRNSPVIWNVEAIQQFIELHAYTERGQG